MRRGVSLGVFSFSFPSPIHPLNLSPSVLGWVDILTKNSWGIFRLTDPPGLQHVLSCTQTGLFHPHPETNTYTDALRPGHVYMQELPFEVKDLRPDAAKFLD